MTAGIALIALGFGLLILCHNWWRDPTDHLTATLSAVRTAFASLFPKGRKS